MSHHPRRRRRRRHFSPLWLPAILAAAAFLYWSNTALQVTEFHPAFAGLPAGFDGCRIALVSDLHGAEFGEDNERLFTALAAEQPEYILCLGDLEDRFRGHEEGYAATVAEGLTAIAPTYYVTGNHEWAVGGVPALKAALEAAGVTVLDNHARVLERGGDAIVLAGIDENSLLQAVNTAVEMNESGDFGIPVPNYVEDVSSKVVKIIQSYTGVVNKMVWRKF